MTSTTHPITGPTTPTGDQNLWRSRLRFRDLLLTSGIGLRSRPGRTALTALGIAIGIASMVTVVGISASSKAAILAELDRFGTNTLVVRSTQSGFQQVPLPVEATTMIGRLSTVTEVAPLVGTESDVGRNVHDRPMVGIDAIATNHLLLEAAQMKLARGRFLEPGISDLPVVVIGEVAAERLNIHSLEGGPEISIGGRPFAVIGMLEAIPQQPNLDRAVFIGETAAVELLGIKPNPTSILLRLDPEQLVATRAVLPRTANPAAPGRVEVSRPSDLLEAKAQVDQNLQQLLLGLGGVALLVGGIGIANVMVISVLERRGEIGLRRAMGATKGHIRSQFVLEAGALSALGGLLGTALGTMITTAYARRQNWVLEVPVEAIAGGIGAALAIGVFAGLYPAAKAARLDPAVAVIAGTG